MFETHSLQVRIYNQDFDNISTIQK